MLTNITLGQYYPVESPVHRLDPRVKLILTIAFIVCVFLVSTVWGYALILAFVYFAARAAKTRVLRMFFIFQFLLFIA